MYFTSTFWAPPHRAKLIVLKYKAVEAYISHTKNYRMKLLSVSEENKILGEKEFFWIIF